MPSPTSLPTLAALAAVAFVTVPAAPRGVDAMDPRGCHEIVAGDCDSSWTAAPSPGDAK